jgi:hypothetical protein
MMDSAFHSSLPAAPRGVALIEALVALAVVGFGMLAVVGSISTLRLNGDVARQRSEALRIAQDRIEEWRGFSVLATTADRTAYEDIKDTGPFDVAAANTTFGVKIEVNEDGDVAGTERPRRKHVLVVVSWVDRIEQPQEVRLSTTIARVDPALRAVGLSPPAAGNSRPSFGRSAAVPPGARQIGDGRSIIVPPGQAAGPPRVVLVFNNSTGLIRLCTTPAQTTATVNVADLNDANCDVNNFLLVQGFLRFYLTPAATADQRGNEMRNAADTPPAVPTLTVERSEPLEGTDICLLALTGNVYEYYCAVNTNNQTGWTGALKVALPLPLVIGEGDADYRVCRFFPVRSPQVLVDDVPALVNIGANLLDHNLVVTTGANSTGTRCSIDLPNVPRVWRHQPAP